MRTHASNHLGFTLVELMVSMAVLALIVGLMVSATNQAGQMARRTSGKIEQFADARHGFDKMTRRVAEATLNTYWDYFDKDNKPFTPDNAKTFIPARYGRQSELRFRSGRMQTLCETGAYRPTHGMFFQAPAGVVEDVAANELLDESLNSWGFFLEVGDDSEFIPKFLASRQAPRIRSRLLELREPTERLGIYAPEAIDPTWTGWFTEPLTAARPRPVRELAGNVVALVILPRLSRQDELARGPVATPLARTFEYDSTVSKNDPETNSKNQLPPVVQVTMVAIDEVTAARLAQVNAGKKDLGVQTDDLFKDSLKLEDNLATPAPGDGDLWKLEQRLIAERALYRIFSTNVAIRGAKWSKAEVNLAPPLP